MSNIEESRNRDPRLDPWRVHPLPAPAGSAAPYRDWIRLPGSMTRALGAYLGQPPSVAPTYEGPGSLAPWEARLLQAPSTHAYVREVTLSVRGERALQARTLSLPGDPAVGVLRKLSNRPLAEVLFQDRDWQRRTAPIPVIELGSRRVGRVCVWGYRSRGRQPYRGGSRILVCEYFEPTLAAR